MSLYRMRDQPINAMAWMLLGLVKMGALVMLVGVNTLAWSAPTRIPVIHINAVDLTPFAIGAKMGHQSKLLFPDIEQRYDAHLQSVLSQTRFRHIVREQLPILLSQLNESNRQELQGVRSVWSMTGQNQLGDGLLSADEYHVLNVLPELGVPPGGVGVGVFDQASAEHGPIVGRNLDWQSTPALRALQAITVYQYPERTVVHLGFAGMLSVLTGFNEQGLFVAYFNASPQTPYQQPTHINATTEISGFVLRDVLRQHASVSSALRVLSRIPFAVSNSLLLADQRVVKALEYSVGRTAQVRTWDSATRSGYAWDRVWQLAVVDCHVLADMSAPCQHVQDQMRWQRLRALLDFHPTQPAHAGAVADILLDTAHRNVALLNDKTLQSLLYVPTTQRLYLSTKSAQNADLPRHERYVDLMPDRFVSSNRVWFLVLVLVGLAFIGVVWFARKTQVFAELRKYFR